MLDSYAVIGNPIAHSKSPLIHTAFAQQTHQPVQYVAILAALDDFKSTVESFRHQGGKGLNVTVPFKLEAFQLSTRLTERATIAQAVNTLKFTDDEILGDNTDGAGLVRDIESNLGIPIKDKRILLMGAGGGAARGVILPLLQKNPSLLAIDSRTPGKAEAQIEQFNTYGNIIMHTSMRLNSNFDIIINATSASLHNALPELRNSAFLPASVFAHATLAYDMMYGREPTHFLKFAQQNGTRQIADGIGMLVEQAAESFFLWRNVRPQTKPVIALLKSPM